MRKLLTLIFTVVLSVLIVACSKETNIYETVFKKKTDEYISTITVSHENNKVLKLVEVFTQKYDVVEGGRTAVVQQYNNSQNNNPMYKLSIEHGERKYKLTQRVDFRDIDLKEYAPVIKSLKLPISDDYTHIVYKNLADQYTKNGYKEQSTTLLKDLDLDCDTRDDEECQRVKNEAWQKTGERQAIIFIVLMVVGTIIWEIIRLKRKPDSIPKEYKNRLLDEKIMKEHE